MGPEIKACVSKKGGEGGTGGTWSGGSGFYNLLTPTQKNVFLIFFYVYGRELFYVYATGLYPVTLSYICNFHGC